ncbi:GNAT family N-acetyltransferase [Paenibacillus sp. 1001270B_150601_E10]|uniref:GNAT family N-acetyltransferase n=1 Tax=Paenibacillus sp. 1001270B_150601_E10 TaxID=2787079 RepID=UPI0018A0ED17|nr:GNAT family N-acetyltransferase [Paenibacillus sp. 1001270B_150601_E10]
MTTPAIPFTIEPMQPSHITEISRLLVHGFNGKFLTMANLKEDALAYFFEHLLSCYPSTPASHRMVAIQGGNVIGTISYKWKPSIGTRYVQRYPRLTSFHPLRKWSLVKLFYGLHVLEHDPKDGECYIADIAVHPAHRSQGVGTHLLQHAKQVVQRETHLQWLSLHVSSKNKRAEELYKQMAFRKHSTRNSLASHLLFNEPTWSYMTLHVK